MPQRVNLTFSIVQKYWSKNTPCCYETVTELDEDVSLKSQNDDLSVP